MINLKGVTKSFDGQFTALDNIELEIPTGVSFGLLGSNGAGKSTILRLLCGVYRATNGSVTIDGAEVYDTPSVKERVFFIDDETVQFGTFTLESLKNYYKGFYPKFSEETFESLRARIDLPLKKRIDSFSKGMKRQAIVIIGLSCMTDYLLLDEAFDGLDPTMRIIVRRMLVDAMLDRGLTTIISSHNLNEINEVCDSVALLHKGKILFNRDLDSVKGNIFKVQCAFGAEYSEGDFKDLPMLHYEKTGSVYHLIVKGSQEEISAMLAGKQPVLLDFIPMTLEEIFIYEMRGLGYNADEFPAASETDIKEVKV